MAERLKENYIFPEVAEQISTLLQKRLADGTYAQVRSGQPFATLLTIQIQEISHDRHLAVIWSPEPLPEADTSLNHNTLWLEEQKLSALLDNYGLHKVERLPGNVGYLDIRQFYNPTWGGGIAIAAMTFLGNASAVIFDLRKCVGGEPDMIALLSSYLFGEEPVHLNSIAWRHQKQERQYWTLPYIPGKRLENVPVYVLMSQFTFSGGEEFAYNLKTRGRARIIGETSGGGAHPGDFYRLHPYFQVFIPNGRAVNPITGTNWEGAGVAPDIVVRSQDAFTVAYRMALTSIIESSKAQDSIPYKLLVQEAQKALEKL